MKKINVSLDSVKNAHYKKKNAHYNSSITIERIKNTYNFQTSREEKME